MSRLLRANFSRLFNSRVFWLTAAVMLAITAASMIMQGTHNNADESFDEICFSMLPSFGLYAAFFTSMFLGTEYSDFTIRNKLTVGHSRSEVFFANLFTCLIASGIFFIICTLSACVGIPFFGTENIDIKACLLKTLVGFFTAVSITSVISAVSQLITRKASGAVTAIFAALAMILAGSYFYNALCEPETTVEFIRMLEDGGMEFGDEMLNPSYIGGALRGVYEIALRIIPAGQQILIANEPLAQPAIMIMISLAVTITVSIIGYWLFRKKDIK